MSGVKRVALSAVLAVGLVASMLLAGKAEAKSHISVSIGFGAPVYAESYYVAPPVYYAPAPVYVVPPPSYYYPPPALVSPPPPPVYYVPPPVYYAPRPIFVRPAYGWW